jgi:DNA-binding transcriptional LysR family regulator
LLLLKGDAVDIDFLKSFIAAADAGSFAEAARRQRITPAAIAHQLRALEKELGAPLMARAGRTVHPTPKGHEVLSLARDLIEKELQLKRVCLSSELKGELRVGTITSVLQTTLPNILVDFARYHPDVKVRILTLPTSVLVDKLSSDELDVIVCLAPDHALSKNICWRTWRRENLVLLASQEMQHRDPLDLLRSSPLLGFDRGLGGGAMADRYLQRHRIESNYRVELSSLFAITVMVGNGLGVCVVPDFRADFLKLWNVCCIPLPDSEEQRVIGLGRLRVSANAHLASEFSAAFFGSARADNETAWK